jgi:hypothetical protein
MHRHVAVGSGELQHAGGDGLRSGQPNQAAVRAYLTVHAQQGSQTAAVHEPDFGQIDDHLIAGPVGSAHEGLQLAGAHQVELPADGDHGDAPEVITHQREITHTPTLDAPQ